MITFTIAYLYILVMAFGLAMSRLVPAGRTGWNLAWRLLLAPFLIPLLLISGLVRNR